MAADLNSVPAGLFETGNFLNGSIFVPFGLM
jgi:hypothetical protein